MGTKPSHRGHHCQCSRVCKTLLCSSEGSSLSVCWCRRTLVINRQSACVRALLPSLAFMLLAEANWFQKSLPTRRTIRLVALGLQQIVYASLSLFGGRCCSGMGASTECIRNSTIQKMFITAGAYGKACLQQQRFTYPGGVALKYSFCLVAGGFQ